MTKYEDVFVDRVYRFFLKRGVLIQVKEDVEYISFLRAQFNKYNSVRLSAGTFHLTSRFIVDATSKYLDIKPHSVLEMMRVDRFKRSAFFYKRIDGFEDLVLPLKTHQSIINRVARRHKPTIKLTGKEGEALSMPKQHVFSDVSEEMSLSFSPLKLIAESTGGRPQALNAAGKKFNKHMQSNHHECWIEQTPVKPGEESSPDRIRQHLPVKKNIRNISHFFKKAPVPENTELFKFAVTAQDILTRVNCKRPVSQQQVMGGVSAKDQLIALGAIISEKQNGRNYHWSHRQGWALNGSQSPENLDPATAGSNYDTLFKVESQLRDLIINKGVNIIHVEGKVEFDEQSQLPKRICYELRWNLNSKMVVFIDPMNSRVPTLDDHKIATKLYDLAREEDPDDNQDMTPG